jgi:hypothetical protein
MLVHWYNEFHPKRLVFLWSMSMDCVMTCTTLSPLFWSHHPFSITSVHVQPSLLTYIILCPFRVCHHVCCHLPYIANHLRIDAHDYMIAYLLFLFLVLLLLVQPIAWVKYIILFPLSLPCSYLHMLVHLFSVPLLFHAPYYNIVSSASSYGNLIINLCNDLPCILHELLLMCTLSPCSKIQNMKHWVAQLS